jgi:hypothetical protein
MRDFDQYGNKITMSANLIIGSSRTLTPTTKLRFTDIDGVRVLQQWWMEVCNLKGSIGEWRDIPIENESEPYKDSELAKALYETWSNQPGYVQWQDGGNSHMQDKAREMASKEENI